MMNSPDAPAIVAPTTSSPDSSLVRFGFENTYARLPERFYARLDPIPVAAPRLVKINVELARNLGLDPDALASPEGVEILAGNRVAEGAEPLAIAYAGHQFGHFVPQLGDGRANLLGEVMGRDGVRYDIQLKGSGPTPFSRRGDGRAALGPVLREYIVSEAMAALGVPTTRALAAVTTGQQVVRETVLPGAVFTRVAASHLRVGTFQYFAARGDTEGIRTLADFAIARHYPEVAEAKQPYRALLEGVIARQARLIAQWMLLGFIHGVMNTDNTSISGETIDYGPCAFMEAYDPDKVFSSIDLQGRYSYSNQPHAAHWNLTRLAEALLPVLEQEAGSKEAALASAYEALAAFGPQFEAAHLAGLRRKLGLFTEGESDAALAQDLLERMATNRADFTLTFRRLCDAAAGPEGDADARALFADGTAYDSWAVGWRRRLEEEAVSGQARAAMMRRASPAFIPRNHVVEAALDAAVNRQDFQPFEELLDVVSRPYEDRPDLGRYATPARPEECVSATFCGT
jgi:serine/tyrosine/threonine adenylyltransferase